jgi:hypothetical protein
MRHGIVLGLAAAILCACQPSMGSATTPSKRADQKAKVAPRFADTSASQSGIPLAGPMTLSELSKEVGATCDEPESGTSCVGGDYDIELRPDCGPNGLFAGVSDPKGALLIDKAPPEDTVRRATLSQGQVVCIEAIARAGDSASYYYVVAMPLSAITVCDTNPVCQKYGDRDVDWHTPHGRSACRSVALGRFSNECPTGWVRESKLEIFAKQT